MKPTRPTVSLAAVFRSCLLLVFFVPALASAQVSADRPLSFSSGDGLETATSYARDSLGNEVILAVILTPGEDPSTGGGFDLETGLSTVWGYIHVAPARKKAVFHSMIQISPGTIVGGGQVFGAEPGLDASSEFTASGAFYGSVEMAAAIRANADYLAFQATCKSINVDYVSLSRTSTMDLPNRPAEIPTDAPLWSVVMHDDADTARQLTCYVVSETGQTICVGSSPSAGVNPASASSPVSMQVLPNPAVGRTRVTLSAPANGRSFRDARVGLYSASGAQVLDLTPSFVESGYLHAEFDAASIPSGSYFVRVIGGGFNSVVGTVTLGR